MSTGQVVLLIVLAAALLAGVLLVWNSRQRKLATPPPRQRRDLDVRVDEVVSGARDVADRAARLASSPDADAATDAWPSIRTDMLASEGDIVNLDVHVGDAPLGNSLAELDRAVHALRDAVEHHLELRTDASADEHALSLSNETVTARRHDVDVALDDVAATRP